jgi:REP element-mobilizing transposase RayT
MKVEFNNLYTHFVFTTIHREPLITEPHRERIEKYMTGIINNNACQLYAIYANPEHVHFLVSRSPSIAEENLANIVANSSAKFINENKLCKFHFQWQMSCSAFSVSKTDIDKVCKYILNQPEHHKKHTFMEEYDAFIKFYQKTIKPK